MIVHVFMIDCVQQERIYRFDNSLTVQMAFNVLLNLCLIYIVRVLNIFFYIRE